LTKSLHIESIIWSEAKQRKIRQRPAHEIERVVTKALRDHISDSGADERSGITDRELVEGLVDRIIVTSQTIAIQLCLEAKRASESATPIVLSVAWKGPGVPNVKGILHSCLSTLPSRVAISAKEAARPSARSAIQARALAIAMRRTSRLPAIIGGPAKGGIEDQNRSTSSELLASVNPTFSWVRLAQRIPVRIKLDDVPPDLLLVAGRTATVSIGKIRWW
jgi:hypothetical protein